MQQNVYLCDFCLHSFVCAAYIDDRLQGTIAAWRRAMPLVSVLMPTYKQDAFIARAIESLLAQEMADWELPSSMTARRMRRPAASSRSWRPRIRYERLQENRGLGAALNRGLRSRGEINRLPAFRRRLLRGAPADAGGGARRQPGSRPRLLPCAPPLQPLRAGPDSRLRAAACSGDAPQDRGPLARASELVTDDMERMMWANCARGVSLSTRAN